MLELSVFAFMMTSQLIFSVPFQQLASVGYPLILENGNPKRRLRVACDRIVGLNSSIELVSAHLRKLLLRR